MGLGTALIVLVAVIGTGFFVAVAGLFLAMLLNEIIKSITQIWHGTGANLSSMCAVVAATPMFFSYALIMHKK
jgi:hypothetical protein